jgi:hypothetical protein
MENYCFHESLVCGLIINILLHYAFKKVEDDLAIEELLKGRVFTRGVTSPHS